MPSTTEVGFESNMFDLNMLATTNWLDALWNDDLDLQAFTNHDQPEPWHDPLPRQDEANSFANGTSISSLATATASVPLVPGSDGVQLAPHGFANNIGNESRQTGSGPTQGDTPNSATSGRTTAGQYYVDGMAGRLPRSSKRRKPSAASGSPGSISSSWTASHERTLIPEDVYRAIRQLTLLHAPNGTTVSSALINNSREECYSKAYLEHSLNAYWTNFHSVLPTLHVSVQGVRLGPLLTLSLCALGQHYIPNTSPQQCHQLHDIVRRLLDPSVAEQRVTGDSASDIYHAELLNHIGCLYSGSPKLKEAAGNESSLLKTVFVHFRDLSIKHELGRNPIKTDWAEWLEQESHRRLALTAWLLDAIQKSHLEGRQCFSLQDASMELPCSERLWNAKSAVEWRALLPTEPPATTLNKALQELYIEKKMQRDRGEFARIVTIHGLYHQLWSVSDFYASPLASWNPVAERQPRANLPEDPVWLPAVPGFAKWQNSTCDALDVLHWQANAAIEQAVGFEPSTVLHLHFARVVLLAPLEQIARLARHESGLERLSPDACGGEERLIRLWTTKHQYKARLAAIHAGVMFWHVRRHSKDAFYEPHALALSALTLWAFGRFARPSTGTQSARGQSPSNPQSSDDEVPVKCSIILLDRPTDDELVQQFIRAGGSMQAHISGVGDLYSQDGPVKVLARACKLLERLAGVWGAADDWLDLLRRLIGPNANERSVRT